MVLSQRILGLSLGRSPVIMMISAVFITESSSHHITIPSQFVHLDKFYDWSDLVLPVENTLPRSVPFLCLIRMASMSAAMI